MPPDSPHIVSTSIVIVGSFNPAIIHPSWFARFGILPPSDLEAEEPDVRLVSPDFALFSIAWLRVQVTIDHFELSTLEEDRTPLLRDAAVNIFTELSHTPVTALGINRTSHFALAPGGWTSIRSALAPADPWERLSGSSSLASLTVQAPRDDDGSDPGFVRVTVENSQRIDGGVFVAVNDHHDLVSADQLGEAAPALKVLDSGWAPALRRHGEYTRLILDLAGES